MEEAAVRMTNTNGARRYVSPLRYPGGKGKVSNYLKLLILQNSLLGTRYIEPYAGGASVALSLLTENYISHAHINDLNPGVYHFWRYAMEDTDSLCSQIRKTPLSISEWKRQRSIYADESSSPEEIGFATFYLNRTNRSGIISRGGVIGGIEQSGKWKIDARFDPESLAERIQYIATFKSRITVSRLDAVDLIESEAEQSDRLLYLDPPYYVKGAGLYDNFYKHDDHVRVRDSIVHASGPWIVSYDASPEILDLYSSCRKIRYTLGYSAASASQGTEVMYFSDKLQLPEVESPSGIPSRVVKNFSVAPGPTA